MYFRICICFFLGFLTLKLTKHQKKATVGARCCVEAVDLDFGSAAHFGIA